jgi:hypothetical protein
MGKPPVSLLTRDRRKRFGDSPLQGLQRSCGLRSQERLDLGPTFFDRRQVGRIRRQIEQPDASGGTGVRHARHLMGFEMIHEEELAWAELRHEHLPQKGQKDLAIGEAFDRHGGDKTLQTQAPQHGDMAPPIDGLRRLCPLAPRRTGVKACQRLMAARFIEKDQVFRREQLHGLLNRGPLPLDLGLLLLGGAEGFFCEAGRVWPTRGSSSLDSP